MLRYLKIHTCLCCLLLLLGCNNVVIDADDFVEVVSYTISPMEAQQFKYYQSDYNNADWRTQYVVSVSSEPGSFTTAGDLVLESVSGVPSNLLPGVSIIGPAYNFIYPGELVSPVTVAFRYDYPYRFVPRSLWTPEEQFFLDQPDSLVLFRATYDPALLTYWNGGSPWEIREVTNYTMIPDSGLIRFSTDNLTDFFFVGYRLLPKDDRIDFRLAGQYNLAEVFRDQSFPADEGFDFPYSGPGAGIANGNLFYSISIYDTTRYQQTGGNLPERYDLTINLVVADITLGLQTPDQIDLFIDVRDFGTEEDVLRRFYSSNQTRITVTKLGSRGEYIEGTISGFVQLNGTLGNVLIDTDFSLKRLF